MSFIQKIKRRIIKARLNPIRVFVFHQVSNRFEEDSMWECDWTHIDTFRKNVDYICKKYNIISLQEAHKHIRRDFCRFKKYAVFTCDDAWESIYDDVVWLTHRNIPVTMFINPSLVMHIQHRERGNDTMSYEKILKLSNDCGALLTFGSHGWNHDNCDMMSVASFNRSVIESETFLKSFKYHINFFAYPCGKHTKQTDEILHNMNLVPVYCDGELNYSDSKVIHRECIDGVSLY